MDSIEDRYYWELKFQEGFIVDNSSDKGFHEDKQVDPQNPHCGIPIMIRLVPRDPDSTLRTIKAAIPKNAKPVYFKKITRCSHSNKLISLRFVIGWRIKGVRVMLYANPYTGAVTLKTDTSGNY